MNYSTLLRRSVDFDQYAQVLYANYPNELERPLILSLIQTLWDRGEANGYAHHMTRDPYADTPPHTVLMHVAFGDHQVANVAAEVQARTIGACGPHSGARPGPPQRRQPVLRHRQVQHLSVLRVGPGRVGQRLTHAADHQHAAAGGRGSAQPPAQHAPAHGSRSPSS